MSSDVPLLTCAEMPYTCKFLVNAIIQPRLIGPCVLCKRLNVYVLQEVSNVCEACSRKRCVRIGN